MEEVANNWREQANINMSYERINERDWCRQDIKMSIEGIDYRQISYYCQIGDTIYNVKFGNNIDAVQNNLELIDSMMFSLAFNKIDSNLSKHDDMETIAIANIRLNTTKPVFEKEKYAFLSDKSTLGKLKIESISGFFYDGKLAAIQIISTKHIGEEFVFKGWSYLYRLKYEEGYEGGNSSYFDVGLFRFDKDLKEFDVTDICLSSSPYKTFDELMSSPLPLLNTIKYATSIDEKLKTNLLWSTIIIKYTPLCKKYKADIEKAKKQKLKEEEIARNNELEII